jgi:hypothetical protein
VLHPDPERLGDLAQRRHDPPVELDREDLGAGGRQGDRQRPEPAPDLQDVVPRPDPGVGGDGPGEVGVRQEVLAQGLGRADPVALGQVTEVGQAQRGAATS